MKNPKPIVDNAIDSYIRRKFETPHTFFDYMDTISSNFTGIDWGKENPELINRTERVSLD